MYVKKYNDSVSKCIHRDRYSIVPLSGTLCHHHRQKDRRVMDLAQISVITFT